MIVLGLFWWDALAHMVEVQFEGIERGDATVRSRIRSPPGHPRDRALFPACWQRRGSGSFRCG